MKKFILVILFSVVCMAYTPCTAADAPQKGGWQEVDYEVEQRASRIDAKNNEGIEIYTKNNVIIIRTTKRVLVRIFTILGQKVSQEYINSGTSELRLDARGIYIVKVGSITQKVAI